MALSHGGGAKGISIGNRLGVDCECDKDVRTAETSVELVKKTSSSNAAQLDGFRPVFNTLVRGEPLN